MTMSKHIYGTNTCIGNTLSRAPVLFSCGQVSTLEVHL